MKHPAETWHRVLICGSRDYTNREAVRDFLIVLREKYKSKLIVIQGGAPGADTLVAEEGYKLDIHVAAVEALWKTRKRGAGPQRNTAMLALNPHEVYAFSDDYENSKGTRNMVEQAEKLDIPTKLVV